MALSPGNMDPRNNRNAIVDRRQFESQLFDRNGQPTPTMYAFAGRLQKEVGGLSPELHIAWAETVFNRAAARGHTLDYELRNNGRYSYWPAHQGDPGTSRNPAFIAAIEKALRNGTNISLGATGNASENVGVGRETYRKDRERLGVETPDTRWWNTKFGSLIRGVGKFIGDVAGAIGHVVSTVVGGVVNAGRWMMNTARDAFSPAQPAPPPHEIPPHHMRAPAHYEPQQPPERRVMTPQPPHRGWSMNTGPIEPTAPPMPRPQPTRTP